MSGAFTRSSGLPRLSTGGLHCTILRFIVYTTTLLNTYTSHRASRSPVGGWRPHGGGRQPMCDPEGCSTVWGAVGGGGPPPPSEGGGAPPPLVDPNPAPFPAGPVQARKHTKLTRCTVNGHCFAALQHFQSSIECCLEFAQRPLLPLVTNHRHICREAKGATDI